MSDLSLVQAKEAEVTGRRQTRWGQAFQLLPATLWMFVFAAIPLIAVIVFSFWKSTGFGMEPTFTLENYGYIARNFGKIYGPLLGRTLLTALVVTVGSAVAAYPVAYTLARVVTNEAMRMTLLLLSIVPFWTNYVTRMVTALPVFGDNGLVNQLLGVAGLHLPFLNTRFGVTSAMIYTWMVFMVGPIFFSLSRIDEHLLEAAADLGAKPARVFWEVTLPMSLPGIMAGSLFTVVLSLGEFAAPQIIGGNRTPLFANSITSELALVHWPEAAALSVLLIAVTCAVVAAMMRFVDIRRQL